MRPNVIIPHNICVVELRIKYCLYKFNCQNRILNRHAYVWRDMRYINVKINVELLTLIYAADWWITFN